RGGAWARRGGPLDRSLIAPRIGGPISPPVSSAARSPSPSLDSELDRVLGERREARLVREPLRAQARGLELRDLLPEIAYVRRDSRPRHHEGRRFVIGEREGHEIHHREEAAAALAPGAVGEDRAVALGGE